ncbi:hypothetical protein [Sphingobium sp. TomMM35A]
MTDNEQALLRGAVTGNCATLAVDIDADEKWIGPDIASFCQALQQRFTRPAQISKRPRAVDDSRDIQRFDVCLSAGGCSGLEWRLAPRPAGRLK